MTGPGLPRVLLVSHDASRTGAPLLLLDLARWLRDTGLGDPSICCLRGGPLVHEFASAGPTVVVDRGGARPGHVTRRALAAAGPDGAAERLDAGATRRAGRHADLVWLSAAPSLRILDGWDPDVPVVAHLHELPGLLAEVGSPGRVAARLARCDLVVVGSPTVGDAAVAAGADPTTVRVADEWIPTPPVLPPERVAADRARVRADLGVADGDLLVGSVATASWRKGIDCFVVLARMLADRPALAGARFVWVGGGPSEQSWNEAGLDVRRAGLEGVVHLAGEQADLEPWWAAMDLFVLTSRGASFPLVCLHAAARRLPVAALDTGIGELLQRAGVGEDAVASLDLGRLADRVEALAADPAVRAERAAALGSQALRRHVTAIAAPRLWSAVREAIGWD